MTNFLLLDYGFDFDTLKKCKDDFTKIICFDFDTHLLLEKNNIQHVLADEYIDKLTIEKIQSKSYSFSEWYMDYNISEYMIYEGINLGKLFHIEFMDMFVPFITKFVQICNIIEKCPNISCTSSLYEIAKFLSKDVKQFPTNPKIQSKKISHEYRFGKLNFSLNLSENQYKKIKNATNFFIRNPTKYSENKNAKTFLFVEIDPIKYKNLFLDSENSDYGITLFNNRRPAVWNVDSWKIIKNSQTNVVNSSSILNSNLKNKVLLAKSELKKQLNLMWSKSDFFSVFFSYEGHSFWKIFSRQFIPKIDSQFLFFIEQIESTKTLFDSNKFDSVLILSEAAVEEQITLQFAKQNGIPVVLLQHGVPYDTENAITRNNLLGFFPNDSNFLISWGKLIQEYVENFGIDKSKIQNLGNPVYDDLFNSDIVTKNEFVLIATSPPMKDFVIDNTIDVHRNYYSILKETCNLLIKLNKKIIIKPHPSLEDNNLDNFKNLKNVEIIKTGDIIPLIKNCELLITFDLSTTILEAQILKKPVLSISLRDYGFGKSKIFLRDTCKTLPISKSLDEIKMILSKNYNQIQSDNTKSFLEDYLSCQGNSAKSLLKFLLNL
ncbi:CDP-glycerol glycerophosphotransferase family protein [Candidatus Nitrosopelagicus sp.]|nr:CDP-glycerol glycerophosphotransferase family protein [Candidatus Nitrosopelagicus sp.]